MGYLDMVFGPDGFLSEKLSGYVTRAGQVRMAEEVEKSYLGIKWRHEDTTPEFERTVGNAPRKSIRITGAADPLLVEAGTGVGKSFAYLVPAIYHAYINKVRTIVVTANINMQEQLCVGPSELVLTADLRHVPASEVHAGMKLVGFDEERVGKRRRYRSALVTDVQRIVKPTYRLHLSDGTSVVCSHDHLWLCANGMRIQWLKASQMVATAGDRPGSAIVRATDTWLQERTWEGGYLAAAVDGEGWLSQKASNQYDGVTTKLGFSQNPNGMLDTVRELLKEAGIEYSTWKNVGDRKCIKIEMYKRPEILKFLGKYRPKRLLDLFDVDQLGTFQTKRRVRVVRKEDLGEHEVIAITTSTRTLIVNGLASHNCNKDLPFLKDALPYNFTFALQKGIRNYLCDARHTAQMGKAPGASKFKRQIELINNEEEKAYRKLLEWGATTRTGDKSELEEEPNAKLWDVFSVSSDDCAGQQCGYAKTCHALKARAMARTVDILVVNYDLFFLNQLAEGFILPDYQAVIMDEGHEAPHVARDRVYGMNVSFGTFTKLFNHLKKDLDKKEYDDFITVTKSFFARLEAEREKQPTWLQTVLDEPEELYEVLRTLSDRFSKKLGDLQRDAGIDPAVKTEAVLTKRRFERCTSLAREVKEFVTLGPDPADERKAVYYLEGRRGGGFPAMRSSYVRMGHILEPIVREVSTVITSATLTHAGNFSFMTSEFGLSDGYRTLEVETPFNWMQQAWLVIPLGMPSPSQNRAAYNQQACEQIARAIHLAKGRTLVLTTSYEMLHQAHAYVKMMGMPYNLLCQGEAPNSKLAQRFREDVSSVLFGTDSFWTGIDVPGESLSCLIIDKLPFPSPDDPVLSYLEWKDRDTFFQRYLIPMAVQKLRQGFGRLIRSVDDRGVVVILDPRLKTEAYGKIFLDSLPRIGWTTTIENIPQALAWNAKKTA
jgi:ATP-dependent DNA helicase DinG